MHRAAGQRVVHPGQPDQRRLVGVGVEHVDAAVGDQDAGDAVGGQTGEHLGDQVGGRRLGPPGAATISTPGRTSWTPARSSTITLSGHSAVNSALVYTDDASSGSWLPGSRYTGTPMARMASSDWLMILRGELVVLEDVTGHHDELAPDLGGQRTQAGDRVAAGGRIPRLGLAFEEVPGHAELPVGGVHETHFGPSLLVLTGRL